MPEEVASFKFEIDGLSSELNVVRVTGTEGMSQLFQFEIELSSKDGDIDLEQAIAKTALLKMGGADEPRYVHGLVSRFEETGHGRERTRYAATLVPMLWTLGLRQDCCIFQEKPFPDILEEILKDAGLSSGDDYEMRLKGTYADREYCVQYRESDLEFISRLMEEEGIFYFFEHTDSGHKVVFADETGAYAPIPGAATIPFRESESGLQSDVEEVHNVRYARSIRPGRVELKDWNFKKVDLDLKHENESSVESQLEIYDYPGRYQEAAVGSARSSVKIDSLRVEKNLLRADSNCRRLTPGHKFSVSEHPRDELNAEFLILRVRHTGRQPQAEGEDSQGGGGDGGRMYENSFEAVPSDVIFRAPQTTPQGLVEGPQTAIVTGPAGEEIHVDAHGRVKVQFHWDRLGAHDEKSSCWVRVSQAWAGGGYGAMVIPRIGHEVVVDFLEGDPDQPLIIGRVYNGGSLHGYTLPDDKTRTSIRSNSTPGGGGFNELRFEDASGSEEMYLHAQKDQNTQVNNDRTANVGHDDGLTVGRNQMLEVKKDRTATISGDETISVTKNESVTIGGDYTLSVDGAATISVTKDQSMSVNGAQTVSVAKDDTTTVGGAQTVSVTKNRSDSVGGDYSLAVTKKGEIAIGKELAVTVGKDMTLNVDGKATTTVGKALKIEAKDEIVLSCGDAKIVLKKNGDVLIEGGKIDVKGSSNVTVKGSKVAAN